MTIYDRVQAALTPLALPMAADMYTVATGAEYPDLYLVFKMVTNPGAMYADNVEFARQYRVQITVHARAGLGALPDIEGAMLAAGFTRAPGVPLPYNQTTGHFGLALDFFYLENL